MRPLPLAAALATLLAAAPARAEPRRLDEAGVIARALGGPRARMAAADTAAAAARVDEARAARLPRIKAQAFATISPEIRCEDPTCLQTDPDQFALKFDGAFAGASLEIVQPLYTFGKLAAAGAAARAGVVAQRALEDAAAADLAVDAARAYWGLKAARELGWMLDDGLEEIDAALARINARAAEGDGEPLTVQDRLRIETLIAEARIQRADAAAGEAQALAAVRALVGDDAVDVDEAELAERALELPTLDDVVARATLGKADLRAARAGATAAGALADLEGAQHWPDLALLGTATVARAQGVDEPPGAFAYDPYNTTSAGVALVLRWQLEPWTAAARTARARASARRATELAALAHSGAAYEARAAHGEASAARTRVDAARAGEQAGRAWVASVLQADAVGTAEPRDLADAYVAWFQMRARLLLAISTWNVAVVRLGRATGEFLAGGARPGAAP